MTEETGPRVRYRTASARKKALAQLAELRNAGQVARALVIIERRDGDFEVLAQEMRPYETPRLLAAAAMAHERVEAGRTAATPEALEMALSWGDESNPGDRIRPKMTKDASGSLVPPPGETLISCPVCRHPRYYVTVGEPGKRMADLVARLSCAHCGNEVSWGSDDYAEVLG